MPAVHPERLQNQVNELSQYFNQPELFVHRLRELLEHYSERVNRPGQSGEPEPLLSAYRVRPPVLRQIIQAINSYPGVEAELILDICDNLWGQPSLECRLISVALMGNLPISCKEQVINRAVNWIGANPEERLVDAILGDGLSTIRDQDPQAIFALSESWLDSKAIESKLRGLQALVPLATHQDIDVFPQIFDLIEPYLLVTPQKLRHHINVLVAILARRSPVETAYFLQQLLSHPESKDTPFMVRQNIDKFPDDLQLKLRKAARS